MCISQVNASCCVYQHSETPHAAYGELHVQLLMRCICSQTKASLQTLQLLDARRQFHTVTRQVSSTVTVLNQGFNKRFP